MTTEKLAAFEKAVKPVMQYLAETHHPHTCLIITCDTAQLMEGLAGFQSEEYIKD